MNLYGRISWAINRVLPAAQKSVLMCLAFRAHESTGQCYPSIKQIEQDTGLKSRAIRNAIDGLEASGLIRVTHYAGRNSVYTMVVPGEKLSTTPALDAGVKGSDPGIKCHTTPAPDAGVSDQTPAFNATPPRHLMPHPPAFNATPPRHLMPGYIEPVNEPEMNQKEEPSAVTRERGSTGGEVAQRMALDWEPSQPGWDAVVMSGVTRAFAEEVLPEFRLYWHGQTLTTTRSGWEAKFVSRAKREWVAHQARANVSRSVVPRSAGGHDAGFRTLGEKKAERNLTVLTQWAGQDVEDFIDADQ